MMSGVDEIVGHKGTQYVSTLFSRISHNWIRKALQKPEVRRYKHKGLTAAHDELQMK